MKKSGFEVSYLEGLRRDAEERSKRVRNFTNQSFHEYQFHNLEHSACQLLDTLLHLCRQNNAKTQLLPTLASRYQDIATSLLTYAPQIVALAADIPRCLLSHKQSSSQSALLALYLSKSQALPVHLIVSDRALQNCSHLLSEQGELDKLTYVRQSLEKEGIHLHNLTAWNNEAISLEGEAIIVLDLFDVNPVEYLPFLALNFQRICTATQLVVYHSHLQDEEVQTIIGKLSKKQIFAPFQVWPQHPTETINEKDEKKLIAQLLDFLREDLNHPEKQDIIIFYPIEMHVKRFASKLQEQLTKALLKNFVTIVSKAHEPLPRGTNRIFLVESVEQLELWNYDYRNVIYVLDYGKQHRFTYNYNLAAYVKQISYSTQLEKAKRMALVGSNRVGRYVAHTLATTENLHYAQLAKELSTYLLKMVYYGVNQYIERGNPRVEACIQTLLQLEIIQKKDEQLVVKDERVVEKAKEGINPIEAKMVLRVLDSELEEEKKQRLVNLLVMGVITMHNEGSLRQAKQEVEAAAHIRPNGIWRKSGYLQSCLTILTGCERVECRKKDVGSKSESFRRKTSKFNENEFDVFGSLFEIVEPKKKSFDQMDIPDLIREYTVNPDLLSLFRDELDHFRDTFELSSPVILLEPKDISDLTALFLETNRKAVALYSGSRRTGYIIEGSSEGVLPDKTSLISQLNERPQFLFVLRYSQADGRRQILMCNSFPAEVYLETFGKLPARRSESGSSEVELEFHGISSSTFEQLWKNNGLQIVRFESDHDCFVEPNQELALIIILCGKDKVEEIKSDFQGILTKIREKLSVSNKMVHYLGNTNLVLGSGGAVKEVVKSDYINKCILGNLHLQVTRQDLEQLFEQFFVLKDIVVNQPEQGKFFKSAIIHFNSQRDYYKFYQFFNECLFYDRLMDVKPLKDEPSAALVRSKQYIHFRWFVWKSHRRALVVFDQPEAAQAAKDAFLVNPELDGVKVVITSEGNKLYIDELNITTDEIFIEEALKAYGTIKEVDILKTPLKEISGENIQLEKLIKFVLNPEGANNQGNFRLEAVEKKKNGLRSCKVFVPNLNEMNKIANDLNHSIGKLGESRLYAQTWFEEPVLVPHGSLTIYQQLLKQTLQAEKPANLQTYVQEVQNRKIYIVLKSGVKATVDFFRQKFLLSLQGYPVPLSDYEKNIILTDIGLANLLDLEEKYHCKFIVDGQSKILSVLVQSRYLKEIKEEIKSRVQEHFFYRVSLNSKAYKFFRVTPEKINQIRVTYTLKTAQIENDSKSLLLEGSALNVQKAFGYLMHFMEKLSVPEEEMINADVCGICCEEPHRPYRLQSCGHKFCRDCLTQAINSALGDVTMFPLKCPHCSLEIVLDDLECILQANQWAKVQTMAANQYVAHHSEVMGFCYTAGCKQINFLKSENMQCDVCLSNYCIGCKLKYHPGMTCEQAKSGGDELFKKYMLENGIRQCPNKSCKIPVVRIDGCYRVTCSRCQKSMCFKCEADKMIAYDDYNLCYAHLNEVHGGYW